MRKMTASQISTFLVLFVLILGLGIGTNYLLLGQLPLGDFRGVTLLISAVIFIYLYAFLIFRLFLLIIPLKEGPIAEGSWEEFGYNVYMLFCLMLFYPVIRNYYLPTPLLRLVYLALGARLGNNSYSAGVILDPPLLEVGSNTIIGHDAVLFCHVVEGRYLATKKIRIGNNVTIGAKAIIMPGVVIDDGAIVAAGSLVRKDSHIGAGEIWGGNPAQLLRVREIR